VCLVATLCTLIRILETHLVHLKSTRSPLQWGVRSLSIRLLWLQLIHSMMWSQQHDGNSLKWSLVAWCMDRHLESCNWLEIMYILNIGKVSNNSYLVNFLKNLKRTNVLIRKRRMHLLQIESLTLHLVNAWTAEVWGDWAQLDGTNVIKSYPPTRSYESNGLDRKRPYSICVGGLPCKCKVAFTFNKKEKPCI